MGGEPLEPGGGTVKLDDAAFSDLVAHWNRAALEPAHWQKAVGAVAGALGAPHGVLFTPELDATQRALAAISGFSESLLQDYGGHWIAHDPWNAAIQGTDAFEHAGTVNFGRMVLDPAALRRTGFYTDFARGHGMHGLLSLKLSDATDGSAPVTHLSLFRPEGMPDFGDAERELLIALWPHLQRAVQSYWLLRKARDHDRIAEQTLDAVPHPAWVLRADATVDFANAGARTLAQQPNWIGTANGRLVRIGNLELAAYRAALAAKPGTAAPLLTAGCVVAGRLRRARVHIAPVREQPAYAVAWPRASALLLLDLPSPEQLAQSWLLAFARHHRLTPAEAQLLRLLARGRDLPAIAEGLNVAYSTVRSHMGTLLAKTGCARQAELMRSLFEA
jgi:DNA-binding CsgD family transcriptional regulator